LCRPRYEHATAGDRRTPPSGGRQHQGGSPSERLIMVGAAAGRGRVTGAAVNIAPTLEDKVDIVHSYRPGVRSRYREANGRRPLGIGRSSRRSPRRCAVEDGRTRPDPWRHHRWTRSPVIPALLDALRAEMVPPGPLRGSRSATLAFVPRHQRLLRRVLRRPNGPEWSRSSWWILRVGIWVRTLADRTRRGIRSAASGGSVGISCPLSAPPRPMRYPA
jgi:hypothetical protein